MSRKNIIFDDNKINKINFYKNKKLFKIDGIDANKILISKKEQHGTKGLNILLGMMIMITLDHYV